MNLRPNAALRSFLFVAGIQPARFPKALEAGADAVVFDLEDTVPPPEKAGARISVAQALSLPRRCKAYVRPNMLSSGYCEADLEAVVGAGLSGVMLPKIESAAEVQAIAGHLQRLEREKGLEQGSIDFIALIESALAFHRLDEIAAASPRLTRLAFGAADYVHDLDMQWTEGEQELAHARSLLVQASRVAGLEPPLDAVVLQIKDSDRFRATARKSRSMGFLGKLCIHPLQIAPCHEAFTPTADEVEQARRIVAAFEQSEAAGSASLQVEGQFVDYAIVHKSRRVLAYAKLLGG